jgi:serine/threonine protein kinase
VVAHHRAWERDVTLKVPRTDPAWLGAAPNDLTAAALRWTNLGLHPHIVYCHYVDRCDGLSLLVVEHRPGGSLRPWIASGRTANLRIGLNLAVQICHGLERAHAEGVWHGGLRPENLLFDADKTLAVGDFGIAAGVMLVQAARDGASAARMAELDPYVAPEQWVEPAAIDAHTDVFALGVCLYEMLSGRRPYDIARGLRREPPDPCTPGRVLPSRLAELLRACVDWEPPTDRAACRRSAASCVRCTSNCSGDRAHSPNCRGTGGTPMGGTTTPWGC